MNARGKRKRHLFSEEPRADCRTNGAPNASGSKGSNKRARRQFPWIVKDMVPSGCQGYFVTKTSDEYNKHVCTVGYPFLEKYYNRRHSLFSRYDQGILLDPESWYSVTPEKIAAHHASILACDFIIDACCGCAGNSIQFGLTCHRVLSIDIDPMKLYMAKKNAQIYGVSDRIEFVCADWLTFFNDGHGGPSNIKADVFFSSPPWGGLSYLDADKFPLESLLDIGILSYLNRAKTVAPLVVLFLPRNTCRDDLVKFVKMSGAQSMEIEKNLVGKHLKGITVYIQYGGNADGSNGNNY